MQEMQESIKVGGGEQGRIWVNWRKDTRKCSGVNTHRVGEEVGEGDNPERLRVEKLGRGRSWEEKENGQGKEEGQEKQNARTKVGEDDVWRKMK